MTLLIAASAPSLSMNADDGPRRCRMTVRILLGLLAFFLIGAASAQPGRAAGGQERSNVLKPVPAEIDSLARLLAGARTDGTINDTSVAKLLNRSAMAWLKAGQPDSAISCASRSLPILQAIPPTGIAKEKIQWYSHLAHKALGKAYETKGDNAQALVHYRMFHDLAQALGKTRNMGAALDYMGVVLRHSGDMEGARSYGLQAIALLSSIPESQDLANAYGNLSAVEKNLEHVDSAALLLRQALPIIAARSHPMNLVQCHLQLADLYYMLGEDDSVTVHLASARPGVEASGYPSFVGQYHDIMGRHLLHKKDLEGALEQGRIALAVATQLGDAKAFAGSAKWLAVVEAARGRIPEALRMEERYDSAHTVFMDVDKVRELTTLRMQFEQDRQRLKDEQLTAEQRAKKEDALLLAGLGLTAALLLGALLFMSRRNALRLATKNTELLAAQELLLQSEKQREAEQVRTRIASDIHDELGGDLTKIALLGNEVKRRSVDDPGSIFEVVDRLGQLSRGVGGALRDIVWSVDPEQDTWQGLVSHASAYAQRVLEGTGIQADLHFVHKGPDAPIDTATKRDIFLLLKEALNNALKHAKASTISVHFTTGEKGFHLVVRDDGAGFDPKRPDRDGNGLRNMRNRSGRLGAILTLDPVPGNGTTLTVDAHFVPA